MNRKLLVAIEAGLKTYPSLRVGQLIVNACGEKSTQLYYMSDEDLANAIFTYIQTGEGRIT